MKAIIHFILLTAIRDKFFICLSSLLFIVIILSFFAGNLSLVEQEQITSVFIGGISRYIIIIGNLIFISFHVQKLYETKEIEAILTKPISKERFVLSYWIGICIAIFLLWLPICVIITFTSPAGSYNALFWCLSLFCECLITSSIGIFCSITLQKSILSSITALSMYFISRLSFFFVAISNSTVIKIGSNSSDAVVTYAIKAINLILPRLDLFAQTHWLLYKNEINQISLSYFIIQTFIYCTLILTATMIDLDKKKF